MLYNIYYAKFTIIFLFPDPGQANVYLSGLKLIIDNQAAENRNLEKKIGELKQEKKVLHQTVVNLLNILDTVEKDLKKRGLKLV